MVHTRDLRHEPWRYRLRAFVSKPANLLLVFFLIVLVVLSLLPMATMLSNMFTVHVGTEKKLLRLPVDSTTLWHFQKLFAGDEWSQVNFWQPLWNSLIVALGSGILGIAVGGTVAWFITRSDLKCKKFISAVFVFPYMMPAWTLALFWTNMFQNSQVGGGNTVVGSPYVADAKVTAEVVDHGRGDKILVFKKWRRNDSRKLQGHRQNYTTIKVTSIKA